MHNDNLFVLAIQTLRGNILLKFLTSLGAMWANCSRKMLFITNFAPFDLVPLFAVVFFFFPKKHHYLRAIVELLTECKGSFSSTS